MNPEISTRRWLPRFSLRTLLLAVCLAGAGLGLWWRWEPWVVVRTDPVQIYFDAQPFIKSGSIAVAKTMAESPKFVLWNLDSGTIERTFPTPKIEGEPRFLFYATVSEGGRFVLATYEYARVTRIWSVEDGEMISEMQHSVGWTEGPVALCPPRIDSSAQRILVSTGSGLRLKDINTGKAIPPKDVTRPEWFLGTPLFPSDQGIFLPSGDGLVTMEYNGILTHPTIRSITDFSLLKKLEPPKSKGFDFLGPVVSSDSAYVAAWGDSGGYCVWEANTGNIVCTSMNDAKGANFSPDNRWFLAILEDGPSELWDLQKGVRQTTLDDGVSVMKYAVFLADSKRVATISDRRELRIWEVSSGRLLHKGEKTHKLTTWSGAYERTMPGFPEPVSLYATGSPNRILISDIEKGLTVLEGRRPEYAWGVLGLPTFWLTLVFSLALAWSLVRSGRPG